MGKSITQFRIILLFVFSLYTNHKLSHANDTIDATHSITDNRTLVSLGGRFELGFFSLGSSKNWYLGIWYKNISDKTVVWVANRDVSLRNRSSGVLKVIEPGILVLLNGTNGTAIWSSNSSGIARNPVAQLLDSGNLVLRDANDDLPGNYVWRSFDYPSSTLLPGMTLGLNGAHVTTWRTNEDPSPGDFTLHVDPTGYPQLFLRKGGVDQRRLGPWNGLYFSGRTYANNPSIGHQLYKNKEGLFYLTDKVLDTSVVVWVSLNPQGDMECKKWVDPIHKWVDQGSSPVDDCVKYNTCGAYGRCTVGNFPLCVCLDKFVPKDSKGWAAGDWSTNGCVRRTPLNCSARNGFIKYSNLKLPDARNSWYNESMTLQECQVECLRNCSCTAYTTLNISGRGSGCIFWPENLVDIRLLTVNGQDLYIKMSSSELGFDGNRKELIVSLTIVGTIILTLSVLVCIWKRKMNRTRYGRHVETHNKDLELPLFDLSTISKATNGFALENKIGEGGFGPVYKGTLGGGHHIAIKRLSETSKQGLHEFKNEVIFVSKLQHRNLVKLLGCCIQGEEKMLIYEYMPNKSLDTHLFDETRGRSLDWPTRYHIVKGIAKGLLYLHEDSRLKIIHRDLKASNILLDSKMHPKISDFGIAKRYQENVIEDKTTRVMGTYGYMSPEYATYGRFSEKSDVFSFGVIMLEIVTGKRNNSSYYGDHGCNLLGHVWTLHMEGRSMDVIDNYLPQIDNSEEVLRLIHVALLCVQQDPHKRPYMTLVVPMLSNDSELPQPNRPGFFMEAFGGSNVSSNPMSSTNEMTITVLVGR